MYSASLACVSGGGGGGGDLDILFLAIESAKKASCLLLPCETQNRLKDMDFSSKDYLHTNYKSLIVNYLTKKYLSMVISRCTAIKQKKNGLPQLFSDTLPV